MKRPGRFLSVIALVTIVGGTVAAAPVGARGTGAWTYVRASNPARTVVKDSHGKTLATFTDGARTVTLVGASRRFSERTATASVTTDAWVRILPAPFSGTVDAAWLSSKLTDTSPDVLAVAMQYVEGAPSVSNAAGLRVAGDASYGPLQPDGTRAEGSDFNDYLGITWTYGATADAPESNQLGSLDCSGFMRMVWGYRMGLPLALAPNGGLAIPRHSYEIYDAAPGTVVISNGGGVPSSNAFARLAAGDLVFFDASTTDGTQLDHVGMYLGRDSAGNYRFISSRKSIDGPTLGDYNGKSILTGTGLYGTSFRAARRL